MSGGALDYIYSRIETYEEDIEEFLDRRIKEGEIDEKTKRQILSFIEQIKNFLYALEWWMSGDIDYKDFETKTKGIERLRELILKKQIENKLKWLLKEIEKKQKKHDKYEQELREKGLYHEALEELGFVSGLNVVKMLIKKAFSGVTEK